MEIRLTPRERIIAALKFEPYEGPVPHYELEFQLTEEVFGRRALNRDLLMEIAPEKRRDALVVLDEAYVEYYGESSVGLTETHPNLLVLRSFSKAFSLAGMRCGYAIAQPAVLDVLTRVLAPWAVSGLTQVAALAAMEDLPYMRETVVECGRARQSIIDGLKELGFVAYNTQANFIIWQVREPARAVQALAARDVYVSNKDSVPQMKGCLRVTVGNSAQSEQFLGIVQELRAKGLLEP